MGKRRDDDDDDDCEDEQDEEKEAMKARKMNIKKKKFIVRKPKLCDSQKNFFDKIESCKNEEESEVVCKPEPKDPCKPKDPCEVKQKSPLKPIPPTKSSVDPCKPKDPCKIIGPSKTKEPHKTKDPCKRVESVTKPTIMQSLPKPSKDICKSDKGKGQKPASQFKFLQSSEEKINAAKKRIANMQQKLKEINKKPGEKSEGLFQRLMSFAQKFLPKSKDSSKPSESVCKPKPKRPASLKPRDPCKPPEIVSKPKLDPCKPRESASKPKDPCKPPESVSKLKDPCKPSGSVCKPKEIVSKPKLDPCKPRESVSIPTDPNKPIMDSCKPTPPPPSPSDTKDKPAKDKKPKDVCDDKKPPSKLKFLRSSQEMIDAAAKSIVAKRKKFIGIDMIPGIKTGGTLQKLMTCAQKCLSFDSLKKLNFTSIYNKASDAMSGKGAGSGRPMKYPYTFSAKFAQFPIRFYAKNQWIWKYYFVSVAVCLPIFYSINNLANSPGNVAKWAEIRRKEALEHHH